MKEPTPEEVRERMNPCEPYSAGELATEFEEANRWLIKRRLDRLAENGQVERKHHDDNRVSYWIGFQG